MIPNVILLEKGVISLKKLFCVILICLIVVALVRCSRVSLDDVDSGTVTYNYNGISFTENLTAEEVKAVVEILDGKKQYSGFLNGIPSCGFDPDIAIIIDGTRYALACDKCGTLQNCTTLRYIDISDEEREVLEQIFTSRGGTFPCI